MDMLGRIETQLCTEANLFQRCVLRMQMNREVTLKKKTLHQIYAAERSLSGVIRAEKIVIRTEDGIFVIKR